MKKAAQMVSLEGLGVLKGNDGKGLATVLLATSTDDNSISQERENGELETVLASTSHAWIDI